MTVRVRVIDKGFDHFTKVVKDLSGREITIGFHDDPELATIAAYNEYGTSRAPARPFLRPSADESVQALGDIEAEVYAEMITGKRTINYGLDLIGRFMLARVRAKIESNVPPPNAPSTIEKKGHGDTLRDTRAMIDGLTYDYGQGPKGAR